MYDELADEVAQFDKILSSPEKWTKGTAYRDVYGSPCTSARAASQCMLGALNIVTHKMQDAIPLKLLLKKCVAEYIFGQSPSSYGDSRISVFNDEPSTTFTDIRAVIALMQAHVAPKKVETPLPERVLEDA